MSTTAAEIEKLNEAFYTAIEGGDLDRMTEVWADDEPGRVAMCVHPGWPMLTGRAEVLRSWALIMANTPYIQFVLTDVHTTVIGDVAVLTCAENILTAADTDDATFAAGRVVATNTFVRTPTGWRLWFHHGSPVLQGESDDDEEAEE
ncbi:3-dehydroquinate dehydratase [Sphaerisporangium melleum]|uniref:3-dehydroquinate dehydratase n=1 Tax=Sphaerisporangium melleum TaxID=321316 RepID=A0A917VHW8_9ACTN|nr:nuclear transport factor 2 family protein [Sphaerisporangium melleum]GGK79982.1 3-dehydroquinate dehydratase [Sphaerisporangium melleum]GII72104.1 3-dehydroquinate dehydratase [Sphaerisporangium melleum]